ncbi:MAG TPA: PP2C family protein-serine/threonine phosphatase, partial [Terracidiphilus sp.]|nr:PP2C family protein-serine/threonine phosphatase [Terracidiphilus sp.]
EVGGDFFQVIPCVGRANAALLVIGDVSGKGLKAAMTVSLIVGALRDEQTRQPAQVLAHLNRVLCGQVGGFVTCSAALIAYDGVMTLANAGHLSPYRNGEEIALPPGLPLGIAPAADYTETTLHLAPGDKLTFLSDGVVEARNTQGELFGFDRTASISTQSAESIAQAAQRWGQEDDITVLTVAFAPAAA